MQKVVVASRVLGKFVLPGHIQTRTSPRCTAGLLCEEAACMWALFQLLLLRAQQQQIALSSAQLHFFHSVPSARRKGSICLWKLFDLQPRNVLKMKDFFFCLHVQNISGSSGWEFERLFVFLERNGSFTEMDRALWIFRFGYSTRSIFIWLSYLDGVNRKMKNDLHTSGTQVPPELQNELDNAVPKKSGWFIFTCEITHVHRGGLTIRER